MEQQVMQTSQSLTGWLRLQLALTLAVQALALALSLTAMSTLAAACSTRAVTGLLIALAFAP